MFRRSARTGAEPCRCGHAHVAHEHLRRGTDCALCPPGACTAFHAVAPYAVARTSAAATATADLATGGT